MIRLAREAFEFILILIGLTFYLTAAWPTVREAVEIVTWIVPGGPR